MSDIFIGCNSLKELIHLNNNINNTIDSIDM